jgi:nucleotide-binding universal stress UspA family protein
LDLSQEKILKSLEDEGKKSLMKVAKKIKKGKDEDFDLEPILRKGIDYEEIVKYSKDKKIDLIVIATHGRTGLLHTLLGSVAEKVIRHAKCPVLVITPSKPRK